jgi:hypothetical protein
LSSPPDAGEALGGRVSEAPPDAEIVAKALEGFYLDVLWELDLFIRRPKSTVVGSAVVVKRVARQHGIAIAESFPLPRLTHEEREERVWEGQ